MTLKFSLNIYLHNVRYDPQYRPRMAHSHHEKPRKLVFAKMAKTTSVSGFHFIFVIYVVDFVNNATNLENVHL